MASALDTDYKLLAGWAVLIALLMLANKTMIGHTLIYYSLLLIILFILLSEYKQLTPLLDIGTIGQLQ